MHRILYISTCRTPMSSDELNMVLGASRRNNVMVDVTGLLVVGGRRFLQVLEGPENAVVKTFDRISLDPRHYAIVKLNDSHVDARAFGNWSMGFEVSGNVGAGDTLEDQVETLVAGIENANLRAYFTGFAKSHTSA